MIKQFNIQGQVAVFIDAANILYSQRTLGWRIDYRRLAEYLKSECVRSQLHYDITAKEVKFIRVRGGADIPKGNLDVELALDAFRKKDTYDILFLFSGDSDFSYLLDLLKKEGKRIFIFSTRGHVSKELLERAKYVNLKKLRADIELIKIKIPPHKAGRGSS
jgi:uncharacterized LabA/DUF88 family protein